MFLKSITRNAIENCFAVHKPFKRATYIRLHLATAVMVRVGRGTAPSKKHPTLTFRSDREFIVH